MGKFSKFFKGAGILAIFGVIAKLIGALYRIPLTNIMGAEGIGLYQMVFPLYTVLLTVSSGGLPAAISKVISGLMVKNDERGARRVLKVAFVSLLIVSIFAALFIIVFRNMIVTLQGNSKASLAYLGIAPSIVLVAVISCLRGYFQGMQNMFPSALSQIIEQIVKLIAGITLAKMLISRGVEYAVLGAVLGVSISELAAMIVLLAQFAISNRRYKKRNVLKLDKVRLAMEAGETITAPQTFATASTGTILKTIYQIAIPVTLGSLVLPLTQVADSILVINMLVRGGLGRTDATQLFGIINGPINSIINMPVVITLSIAVALLPMISGAMSLRDKNIPAMVGSSLKYGMLIGLPCTVVFAVFAPEILSILYSRGLSPDQLNIGAVLLRIGSLSVVYVSILQIATAVLQGMGRAHIPAVNLLVGGCFKIVFTIFLLPHMGITGAIVSTVICYAVTCLLDIWSMKKYTSVKLSFYKFFVAPALSCIVMIAVAYGSFLLLNMLLSLLVSFVAALVLGAFSYIGMVFLTKGITKPEIMSLLKK